MSTNDDSASRRGRRPEQGGQQRRPQGQEHDDGRWNQSPPRDQQGARSYREPRGRSEPPQPPQGNRPYDPRQTAYSAFSRHSYEPPRQETPAPPPPPAPRRAPEPAPQAYQQNYYQEPAPRNDPPPRAYAEQTYSPPPQPSYEPDLPPLPSAYDNGRDDLFGRESGQVGYEQNHYGTQQAHRSDGYDQHSERDSVIHSNGRGDDNGYLHRETSSPLDDYERGFAARMAAQESQSSRFFLPEEPAPQPRQAQPERGYAPPQQNYDAGGYHQQHEQPAGHYGAEYYDGHHEDQHGGWGSDMHGQHEENIRGGLPQTMSHGGELDEDFFADEDEFDHEDQLAKPKKGRKKLIAAALVGAIGVGAGGAYVYKTMKGGHDGSPPLIRAQPSKELPSNPGGKQYANGDKTIYDRLGPDGTQTQSAAFVSAPTLPASTPSSRPQTAPATGGSSLEDRIDEALRRAQSSGGGAAPASIPAPSGGRPSGDMPTVVRGETYRPDGTRVDAARPSPGLTGFGNTSQLPPPFGNGPPSSTPATTPTMGFRPSSAPAQAAAPAAPPQHVASASRSIAPASTPAAPASSSADGFYVSLKSAPDEKAIQRDLTVLADKYKSALGDVQLTTKVADLGDKGVTYRAVAGPLNTRQEAMDLCNKLKAAGGSCFVTK